MTVQIQHYQDKLAFEWDSADLFEHLEKDGQVTIIDARKKFAFDTEHIPGAISLHHSLMTEEGTSHLSKDEIYVCYCDGIGCNASTKGALKMAQLGFNVKELIGGIDWWKRDGYATEGEKSSKGLEIQCAC